MFQWLRVTDCQGRWIRLPQLGKFRAVEKDCTPTIAQTRAALPGRCWLDFGQLQPPPCTRPSSSLGAPDAVPSQSQGLNSKRGSQFLRRPRVLKTQPRLELWNVSFPDGTAAMPAQPQIREFKWPGLRVIGGVLRAARQRRTEWWWPVPHGLPAPAVSSEGRRPTLTSSGLVPYFSPGQKC